MSRKGLYIIISIEALVLLAAAVLGLGLFQGWIPRGQTREVLAVTEMPTEAPTEAPTRPPTDPPTQPPADPPTEPEPTAESFLLTFAGDCTLGAEGDIYWAASCFPTVVGEDYAYPFANVQTWFAGDDLTLVNLEGPLTDRGSPEDKQFAFRGSPDFVNILTGGSVEWVSLANNHSRDYGSVGYQDTRDALDAAGVCYAGDGESSLIVTDRGLTVGIFAVAFWVDVDSMADAIASLQEQGAEVVIVSFHFGEENTYHPNGSQQSFAHAAIDAGADIVFGHHPHVLQPIEEYGDGVIFYSLGNFSFGGNSLPRDMDTAVIQQEVIREVDGTVYLGGRTIVPCCLSSSNSINNYQPTPAPEDSERYSRVLSKLDGTYTGPDFPVRPTDPVETEPEETEEQTLPEETLPEETPGEETEGESP